MLIWLTLSLQDDDTQLQGSSLIKVLRLGLLILHLLLLTYFSVYMAIALAPGGPWVLIWNALKFATSRTLGPFLSADPYLKIKQILIIILVLIT